MVAGASVLTMTPAAAERLRQIRAGCPDPDAVVRLTVSTQGCSGLSYQMEYSAEGSPEDEVIEDQGALLHVDPQAVVYLLGSELDYVDDKVHSGFVFNNPNEKGRCGCGESFHI